MIEVLTKQFTKSGSEPVLGDVSIRAVPRRAINGAASLVCEINLPDMSA